MYQNIQNLRKVLPLEREPGNPEVKFTVAVKKTCNVVGRVPFNLVPVALPLEVSTREFSLVK